MTLKIEGDVPGFNNCYHFHASPKYRRHAFSGDIARTIHEILESKANELGWRIYSIAVDTDHVHFLIQSEASPSEIAHRLFGYASYALRKKFPELKEINADHLWVGINASHINSWLIAPTTTARRVAFRHTVFMVCSESPHSMGFGPGNRPASGASDAQIRFSAGLQGLRRYAIDIA